MDLLLIINKFFNLFSSILGLSILIIVHELGHFVFCKIFDFPAPKFSIGFGPVVFKKLYKGTEFILSLLPFGGFVQVGDETNNTDESQLNILKEKSIYKGLLVLFGGIIFNFIFSYFAVIFVNVFAPVDQKKIISSFITNNQISKIEYEENEDLKNLFLKNDLVKSIDKYEVKCQNDFCLYSLKLKNNDSTIKIIRNNEEKEFLIPENFDPSKIKFFELKEENLFEKVKNGIKATNNIIVSSFYSILSIFKPKNLSKVSGFLGILKLGSGASKLGFYNFLSFLAIISVSLAFGNILPIPILDGGQAIMLIFSKIFGKFFPFFLQRILMYLSFGFIIILTVYTTYKDILNWAWN